MKKLSGMLAVALFSFCSLASDLPVPAELIGKQTVGIVHINMKDITYEQIVKTATEKFGPMPDPNPLEPAKIFVERFKAAGGEGVSVLINADKKTDASNVHEALVLVINAAEGADPEKFSAMLNEGDAPIKNIAAPECPKKMGNSFVWYNAKYKLPTVDADRAKAFGDPYTHMGKGSSISIVIVPDEEANALVEAAVKDAKPDEAAVVKALLSASGLCVFTNVGAAADPSLKILIMAEDAESAGTIKKAVTSVIAEIKKDAPPPAQVFLDTLKIEQKDTSVQLAVDLSELTKTVKAFIEPPK